MNFPPEVLLHIFRWLGPCSLLNCASVNRDWCELARSERLWQRHKMRVKRGLLGAWAPVDDGTETWRVFSRRLLANPICYMTRFMSLIAVRVECMWGVQIGGRDGFRVIVAGRQDYIDVVKKDDGSLCILSCVLPIGLKLIVNETVDTSRFGRFHSIVRDSDCREPRDERPWIEIESK